MIQQLLEELGRAGVKDIAFDTRREIIKILMQDETSVQFEEVVSFFFTDDFPSAHQGEGLSPIVFDALGLMPVMDYGEEEDFLPEDELYPEELSEDYFDELPLLSYPNISVSLGEKSLLIEARKMRIGEQLYHLSELFH